MPVFLPELENVDGAILTIRAQKMTKSVSKGSFPMELSNKIWWCDHNGKITWRRA